MTADLEVTFEEVNPLGPTCNIVPRPNFFTTRGSMNGW